MLKHQKKAIEEAEQQLAALQLSIRKAEEIRTELENEANNTRRELHKLQETHSLEMQRFKTHIEEKEAELRNVIAKGNIDLQSLVQKRDSLAAELQDLQDTLQNEQTYRQQALADYDTQIQQKQSARHQLENDCTTAQQSLQSINEQITVANDTLEKVYTMLAEGEAAFSKRALELRQRLTEWEQKLQQVRHEFGVYEVSMKEVRAADETRKAELDKQQSDLAGRERKLIEARQDFKDERDVFYKTKALQ